MAGDEREGRLSQRKQPQQERSIQRLDAILSAATDMMWSKGVEGLKMTELAQAAGVPIGSLYQFFPSRAAVLKALHDRHTSRVEAGTERVFSSVQSLREAQALTASAVDLFYAAFRDDPIYLPVWLAAEADRDLQRLNSHHADRLTDIVVRCFEPLLPEGLSIDLEARVALYIEMTGATVRRAMLQTPDMATRLLTEWKVMVGKILFTP